MVKHIRIQEIEDTLKLFVSCTHYGQAVSVPFQSSAARIIMFKLPINHDFNQLWLLVTFPLEGLHHILLVSIDQPEKCLQGCQKRLVRVVKRRPATASSLLSFHVTHPIACTLGLNERSQIPSRDLNLNAKLCLSLSHRCNDQRCHIFFLAPDRNLGCHARLG